MFLKEFQGERQQEDGMREEDDGDVRSVEQIISLYNANVSTWIDSQHLEWEW